MILRWVLIRVFVEGILAPAAQSLRFELQSGQTKCIADDIKSKSLTMGQYLFLNPNEGQPLPNSHKINVRVTSSHGHTFQSADKVEKGQFVFTAAEQGDYMACFWTPEHSPHITLTVDFDWRTGVHFKDWSNVAKKGQVDAMELELKKLYDTVNSIHEEMLYLRAREEEMQELNKAGNSKMFWMSFISLLLCLSVPGIQFWHSKAFFEKKKLI